MKRDVDSVANIRCYHFTDRCLIAIETRFLTLDEQEIGPHLDEN